MEVVHRRAIKNAPYNPRMHDEVAFRKVRDVLGGPVGAVGPINVNRRTEKNGWKPEECGLYILGGHLRTEATDAVEKTDDYYLNVSVVELTRKREMETNAFLNNLAAQGAFDPDKLQAFLHDEVFRDKDGHMDYTGTGFERIELETMFPEDRIIVGSFYTPLDQQPDEAQQAAGDLAEIQAGKKAEREAEIALMKQQRKEHRAQDQEKNADPAFFFSVVCDTRKQAGAILAKLNKPEGTRYVTAYELAGALNMDPEELADDPEEDAADDQQ